MPHRKIISIVIADDHTFFREGLIMVLKANKQYNVVGAATNGEELIELALKHDPDIIITDISMPVVNGIDAVNEIFTHNIHSRVIVLSMHTEESIILRMLNAGAMGYLDKNTSKKELYEAIDSVAIHNRVYFSESSNYALMELMARSAYKPFPEPAIGFSSRELEVIEMICKDFSTKEIGARLSLSPRTIDTHRERIMERMNVKSVAGLVAYAFTHRLIPIPSPFTNLTVKTKK